LIAQVPEEGPQGAGQELGAFPVQPGRLSLDKLHHITGGQTGEPHGSLAELMCEKSLNERGVIRNRGAGEGTRVAQVLHIRLHPALCRGPSTGRDRFRGDHILMTQKRQEVPERSGVTGARLHLPPAMTQVPGNMTGVDTPQRDAVAHQPMTEPSGQPNLSPN
jgi:hypothetical protein